MEGEGAERRADHEGPQRALGRDGRDGGDDVGAVPGRAGDGCAGAAEVGDGLLAQSNQQDQGDRVGDDRDGGHLAGATGGPGRLEETEEVDPEQLGRLVSPGTEDDVAVLAGEDREGPDLCATDLVRQRRTEGELRG